jgi:hypothetical protein
MTIMQLYEFINKCLKLIRINLSCRQGGISSYLIPSQHCFILTTFLYPVFGRDVPNKIP